MGRKAKAVRPPASVENPEIPKNAPKPPPKIHRIGGPGRPKGEIDYDQFEALCAMQCTQDELCGWFSIDEDTLNKRLVEKYGGVFSEIYPRFAAEGRMSLRRQVWLDADPLHGDNSITRRYLYQKHLAPKPPSAPGNTAPGGVPPAPDMHNPELLATVLGQIEKLTNRPPEDQ